MSLPKFGVFTTTKLCQSPILKNAYFERRYFELQTSYRVALGLSRTSVESAIKFLTIDMLYSGFLDASKALVERLK